MNYDFVPFPDRVERRERKEVRLDRRLPGHYFGAVELTLRCLEPLHVGSGFKALHGKQVVRGAARSGEEFVLPGSSFKGVLRSRYEAVTRSCALAPPAKRGRSVPVRSRSRPDVRQGRLTDEAVNHPVFQSCGGRSGACPACALFGYQQGRSGQRARVTVTDLRPVGAAQPELHSVPEQFGPRLHKLGDSVVRNEQRGSTFVVGPLYGRKFAVNGPPGDGRSQSVEVLPAGTELRGQLRLFNVAPAELGALLVALGLDPRTWMKLGAAKGHGLGAAVVLGESWRLRDAGRRETEEEPAAWAAAFRASSDRWDQGEERLVALRRFSDGA